MAETYSEQILFDLSLPPAVVSLKDTCREVIVPPLLQIAKDLSNPDEDSATINVLSAILLALIIRQIMTAVFSFTVPQQRLVAQQEIEKEVKMLTAEVQNMKKSMKKIVEENSKEVGQKRLRACAGFDPSQIERLITFYEKASYEFECLAQFMLNSQNLILMGVKKVNNLTAPQSTPKQDKNQELVDEGMGKQLENKKTEEDTNEANEGSQAEAINQKPPKAFKIGGPKRRVVPPPPRQ